MPISRIVRGETKPPRPPSIRNGSGGGPRSPRSSKKRIRTGPGSSTLDPRADGFAGRHPAEHAADTSIHHMRSRASLGRTEARVHLWDHAAAQGTVGPQRGGASSIEGADELFLLV